MKETVYYKPQIGKATKDILREISPADQQYIKRVMTCYKELAEVDPRPEFKQWFNMPNEQLPRQPQQNNERNSGVTFCNGIIDKLTQAPHRRDLSPKQCLGIEALSKAISEIYDDCPYIVFENKTMQNKQVAPPSFDKLFRKKK